MARGLSPDRAEGKRGIDEQVLQPAVSNLTQTLARDIVKRTPQNRTACHEGHAEKSNAGAKCATGTPDRATSRAGVRLRVLAADGSRHSASGRDHAGCRNSGLH